MDEWMMHGVDDDDNFVFVDGCKTHDAWWIDTLLVEEFTVLSPPQFPPTPPPPPTPHLQKQKKIGNFAKLNFSIFLSPKPKTNLTQVTNPTQLQLQLQHNLLAY